MSRRRAQSSSPDLGSVVYINTKFLEQGATLCRYLQSKEAWRMVETLVIVSKDEENGNRYVEDEEEEEEEMIVNADAATKRGGINLIHSPISSNSNRGTSSSSRSHRSGTVNASFSPAGSDIGNSHNESKTDIPTSSSSSPSKGGGGISSNGMMDSGGGSSSSSAANATPVTIKHLFKIVFAFVAKATKLHTVIFDGLTELTTEEISSLSKALNSTKTKLRWLSFINCPHLGDGGMRYACRRKHYIISINLHFLLLYYPLAYNLI